jgi:hypothetical protein
MKKLNVYGVELTELENMIFSKWVSNEGISMNSKTVEERKQITINWLNEYEKTNQI